MRSRLMLLNPAESARDSLRRGYLYITTLCALGFAFQLNALAWEPSHRQASVSFFAPAVLALLTGTLALVILQRAKASIAIAVAESSDFQAVDSIAKLRATRTGRLPAIGLHELLPTFEDKASVEQKGKSRETERKAVKSFDPWSKILEELGDRDKGRRDKRRV